MKSLVFWILIIFCLTNFVYSSGKIRELYKHSGVLFLLDGSVMIGSLSFVEKGIEKDVEEDSILVESAKRKSYIPLSDIKNVLSSTHYKKLKELQFCRENIVELENSIRLYILQDDKTQIPFEYMEHKKLHRYDKSGRKNRKASILRFSEDEKYLLFLLGEGFLSEIPLCPQDGRYVMANNYHISSVSQKKDYQRIQCSIHGSQSTIERKITDLYRTYWFEQYD